MICNLSKNKIKDTYFLAILMDRMGLTSKAYRF